MMDRSRMTKTWFALMIPMIIGILLIVAGIYLLLTGKPTQQIRGGIMILLGIVLALSAGQKIRTFKKILKEQEHD